MRILGIDPGSIVTGYGIIDMVGYKARYVDSGFLRIPSNSWPERLSFINSGIKDITKKCQPDVVAIERVFMHRNADSALKLGQARGAAICGVMEFQVKVTEFSPSQIKQATVGKGNATKVQVQHMVKILLNLKFKPQADEADALAAALCQGQLQHTLSRIPQFQIRSAKHRRLHL